MNMSEEQGAIHSVLSLLLSCGEDWSRYHRSPKATSADRVAKLKFQALTNRELNNCLKHNEHCGHIGDNKLVFIKPPLKEPSAVTALWYRWDYSVDRPKCAFFWGLWRNLSVNTSNQDSCMKSISFVGFRYESPEMGDNHNYYHVQPSNSMGDKDNPIDQAIAIPRRYPTVPLPASSSVDLLLCLILSIYGMRGLQKLWNEMRDRKIAVKNATLSTSIQNLLNIGFN